MFGAWSLSGLGASWGSSQHVTTVLERRNLFGGRAVGDSAFRSLLFVLRRPVGVSGFFAVVSTGPFNLQFRNQTNV